MYSCPLHNWNSFDNPCPICNKLETRSANADEPIKFHFPQSPSGVDVLVERLTEIRNQLYEEMPSGEIKDSWGFIQAIKKHFERLDEFIDKELAGSSHKFIDSSKLVEALEDFLCAVPPQTDDADWWPDNLSKAVESTKKFLAQYKSQSPQTPIDREPEGIDDMGVDPL